MPRRAPVVVDTSVWIPFLEGGGGPEVVSLRKLIRADRAAITGQIVAEILQGARGARDGARLRSALGGVHFLQLGRAEHERAGELSAALRRAGRMIPLSDALVATAALTYGLPLLAADDDFDAVPGLVRHAG